MAQRVAVRLGGAADHVIGVPVSRLTAEGAAPTVGVEGARLAAVDAPIALPADALCCGGIAAWASGAVTVVKPLLQAVARMAMPRADPAAAIGIF